MLFVRVRGEGYSRWVDIPTSWCHWRRSIASRSMSPLCRTQPLRTGNSRRPCNMTGPTTGGCWSLQGEHKPDITIMHVKSEVNQRAGSNSSPSAPTKHMARKKKTSRRTGNWNFWSESILYICSLRELKRIAIQSGKIENRASDQQDKLRKTEDASDKLYESLLCGGSDDSGINNCASD